MGFQKIIGYGRTQMDPAQWNLKINSSTHSPSAQYEKT